MEHVIVANAINAVAAVISLGAHAQISMGKNDNHGYWLYVISCVMFVVGSALLLSWPVVVLNIIWGWLSWEAIKKRSSVKGIPPVIANYFLYFTAGLGVSWLILGNFDSAAYATTAIYVLAYALFCGQKISKLAYLTWCTVGFVLLIPHLLQYLQYSVMAAEGVGFAIGIVAIAKILYGKSKLVNSHQ